MSRSTSESWSRPVSTNANAPPAERPRGPTGRIRPSTPKPKKPTITTPMTKRDLEEANEALQAQIKQLEKRNVAILAEAKRRAAAEIAQSVEALITKQHAEITSASQEIDEAVVKLSRAGQGVSEEMTKSATRVHQTLSRLDAAVRRLDWRNTALMIGTSIAGAALIFFLLLMLRPGWSMTERQQQDEWLGQMLRHRIEEMAPQERRALNDLLGFPLAEVEEEP